MPRSITSIPATRFWYLTALILPNRYGGSRFTRSATGMEKESSAWGISDSLRMVRCRGNSTNARGSIRPWQRVEDRLEMVILRTRPFPSESGSGIAPVAVRIGSA